MFLIISKLYTVLGIVEQCVVDLGLESRSIAASYSAISSSIFEGESLGLYLIGYISLQLFELP